ncbi:MAG: bis(5'-nucleosyl)-tetraphosphatase (symmetrical) YqeK [Bacillota bacterium]|nr:bis(5'-nucleosyl)-tetraphosphatase (symmetrical) YqeK [Bacillota bacterium]
MTVDELKKILANKLSPKRYRHSINVMETAKKLARAYGENSDKAALAGLLHDCARDIKGDNIFFHCEKFGIAVNEVSKFQPDLLHGPLGAEIAKYEYGIEDVSILNAIRWHTTGHEHMDKLCKIIYIADYIEPGRSFPGVEEVRQLAYCNLDDAMITSLDRTIKYVITKGALLHPDTIDARNSIIMEKLRTDT